MSDLSHISLGQSQCPVCGSIFDSGEILLDKRLRPTLEQRTIIGFALCPEHQSLYNDGFLALIEVEPGSPQTITEALRTGRLAHIRREVAEAMFSQSFPAPICFVEMGVLDKLISMLPPGE